MAVLPDPPARFPYSLLTAANLHRLATVLVSLVVAWDHYRHPVPAEPTAAAAPVDPVLAEIAAQRKALAVEQKELEATKQSLIQIRESIVQKMLAHHP